MWRPDRHERANALGKTELRECVARIESAEAVRDEVDALVRKRRDLVDEDLRTLGNRARARQAYGMCVTTERCEVIDDAPEVVNLDARDADLIETEQTVDEHDGQGRTAWRRSLDGNDALRQ